MAIIVDVHVQNDPDNMCRTECDLQFSENLLPVLDLDLFTYGIYTHEGSVLDINNILGEFEPLAARLTELIAQNVTAFLLHLT